MGIASRFLHKSLFYRVLLQKRPMKETIFSERLSRGSSKCPVYLRDLQKSLFCRALLQKRPMKETISSERLSSKCPVYLRDLGIVSLYCSLLQIPSGFEWIRILKSKVDFGIMSLYSCTAYSTANFKWIPKWM